MSEGEKLYRNARKPLIVRFASFILNFWSCCSKKHRLDEYPIIRLVNLIIQNAIKKGASEIQFEPLEKSINVKYKIDNVIYPIMTPPYRLQNVMIKRIKVMADLKIAGQKKPQQGLLLFDVQETGVQYRFEVSITQTEFGEKAVLILQQ